jgi:hypothetical protein
MDPAATAHLVALAIPSRYWDCASHNRTSPERSSRGATDMAWHICQHRAEPHIPLKNVANADTTRAQDGQPRLWGIIQ